jgi:AAA15 family ATPase/GTPase
VIEKIKVKNFKSFRDLKLELGVVNIIIGANASGKSNFVQIFKFMKDITTHGLENAISLQGGIEYLRNININSFEDFSLEVLYKHDKKKGRLVADKDRLIGIEPCETIYNLAMKFSKRGIGFHIIEDKLTWKCNSVEIKDQKRNVKRNELGTGEITISNIDGKIETTCDPLNGLGIDQDALFPAFMKGIKLSPQSLLIEPKYPFMQFFSLMSFDNISTYDFDPKLPKKATPITGKADLEEDGGNLAIVLKNIASNNEKKRKFTNIITDLLPFVKDVDVEKLADKSLLFKLKETYSQKEYIPASLISDGTINIAALILALYFDKNSLIIIEEPERNIHPHLMSRVVNMMKDASKNKQIIVTTHNPEMIKHADIKDILILSRDEEGFSHISKPMDKSEIGIFLENEMGLADLFVDNLLGV